MKIFIKKFLLNYLFIKKNYKDWCYYERFFFMLLGLEWQFQILEKIYNLNVCLRLLNRYLVFKYNKEMDYNR